ncbi:hypothetical protein Golomagni_06431 [Golovinomyces magnicellulatus]|nr:hypothetical protein Golomagni_06431 [Golovinomyces magnicellulatus]
MSSDNGAPPPPTGNIAHRRSSITQAALSNLFGRGPSNGNVPPIIPPSNGNDPQGRRLSVSTIGLSGTSPTNSSVFNNIRRGSVSTSGGSIDESAIEDDDAGMGNSRTAPTTPFTRRMSFGGSSSNPRGYRPSGSPGNNGNNPTSPPPPQIGRRPSIAKSPPSASAAWSTSNRRTSSVLSSSLPQASFTMNTRVPSDNGISRADQQGFNWSEQLRSRAESSVSGARPSFSFGSPPGNNNNRAFHDRARSVSEMSQPPSQVPTAEPKQPRPKPDAFQERILKGDFYMD